MSSDYNEYNWNFMAVVNGYTIADAFNVYIHPSSTVGDLKSLITKHLSYDPKYNGLNLCRFYLWRALLPHPHYFKDIPRVAGEVVDLSDVKVKCRLVTGHKVRDVLNDGNFHISLGLMVIVIQYY
ncbi:hypothetical protein BGZ95_009908 [Linnemannia exigua]|uniref:Uncharacterized protein n=1 Tax=Linnemannia exigua TaxID=604196 RepID=A0AAD4H7J0_9FUNG|nr:hypothetical protein BGZ95_009908 [Linnemannia exigua]